MRAIDGDALIHELNNSRYPGAPYVDAGISIAIGKVCDAQTIEPERQRGQWIDEPNCYYRCSRCGSHYPSILGYMDYKYCPNCGADMRDRGMQG